MIYNVGPISGIAESPQLPQVITGVVDDPRLIDPLTSHMH